MEMDNSTMKHGKGDMKMNHKMWMWFHTVVNDTVLFDFWKIQSTGEMIWSCLIIFTIGMSLEGVKYLRWRVDKNGSLSSLSPNLHTTKYMQRLLSGGHLMQTLLFILQVIISYLLMLVFMTFSIWLCLAVTLGATTGFYLFGARPNYSR